VETVVDVTVLLMAVVLVRSEHMAAVWKLHARGLRGGDLVDS
jgi:hypothetical protein